MSDDDVPHDGALEVGAPDHDDHLAAVDHAFFQLRRMWAKPHLAKQLSGQEGGKRIQLSNLMVISAVARLHTELTAKAAGATADESPGPPAARQATGATRGTAAKEPASTAHPTIEVTVGAVAERLDVDPSTASRLVTHAIEAGFVARRASPVDARRAHLELTTSGRRVMATATRFRLRYFERLMADWDPAEMAAFGRLLRRFTDAAVAMPFAATSADIFEAARSSPDTGTRTGTGTGTGTADGSTEPDRSTEPDQSAEPPSGT